MEVQKALVTAVKKPVPTAKSLIHQKYGSKACYTIEEVQQPVDSGCPGLVPKQTRSMYKCCLTLPDLTVTSEACTRKKDAEQAAAKLAVEKLNIQPTSSELTPQEAQKELAARLTILFSDEFLSSSHPLVGHLKVALGKAEDLHGKIPLSAIAACDVKVNTLCKVIDPKAESHPIIVSSFIWKAARMSDSVCTTDREFWIGKHGSYSSDALEMVMNRDLGSMDTVQIKALRIPYTTEGNVEALSLDISSSQYYMDEIAQKLHAGDASQLLVSRTIGKASSEMKLFFSIPEAALKFYNSSADPQSIPDGNGSLEPLLNKLASYLTGQVIYGDAILANIGYTWKSPDLFYEDVNLSTYYRMLLAKAPDGHYKLSRGAILVAELPTALTSRSNWKGPLPRELLSLFCRQHRLLEPLFSVKTTSSETEELGVCKKIKLQESAGAATDKESDRPNFYKCDLKILSKKDEIILEFSSDTSHKKEFDAIQNVALEVLNWLNKYFKQIDMSIEKLAALGLAQNIVIYPPNFSQEFALLTSIYGEKQKCHLSECTSLGSMYEDQADQNQEDKVILDKVEGEDLGVFPSPGSVTCITYSVTLRREGEAMKELIESKDEFEFEVGTGAVNCQLEACITQLSVNQSAQFSTMLPSRILFMAAAGDCAENLQNLSLSNCSLEYNIKVLRITEPLEERMEQAFFSPPLSKQRVEFAVKHINDSHSTSLVDFGCGSGSLLDSLLEHSTTLERIIGVDISRKGLTRAAKIIHSKLIKNSALQESIRSAVLYDGSILDFDSRVYGVDIGTCLEVIEHMEEEQACLFGDMALSSFCPRILVVSTPNYEYNAVLQRSSSSNKEEDSEDKSAACRFRNHDHKFEWTRKQFEQWATNLAGRHNYSVEFSGVGGFANVEPGFASQIAVFRRSDQAKEKCPATEEPSHPYEIIWEWNSDKC